MSLVMTELLKFSLHWEQGNRPYGTWVRWCMTR
uniref:Uncharacterized protein n=1 Tax=Anguilla anguilla TaxID=7936 RepID=A0A0E9R8Q5_ANGAN